jgi:hypothetical protein
VGITFAVRGDSFDARYSKSGKTPSSFFDTKEPEIVTDLNAIGGSVIKLDDDTTFGSKTALLYPGALNFSQNQAVSILIRVAFSFDLTTGGSVGIFDMGGFGCAPSSEISLVVISNGDLVMITRNEAGGLLINGSKFSHRDVFQIQDGVYNDLVITYDGQAGDDNFKTYVNGVLQYDYNINYDFSSPRKTNLVNAIALGMASTYVNSKMNVNEFVIWDEVIDPTNIDLQFQSGSLNGPTRNQFVDVELFDGQNSTNPGTENVLYTADPYYIKGTRYNGTFGEVGSSDIRYYLNKILDTIGAPLLTDDEYNGLELSDVSDPETVYNALLSVLNDRDTVGDYPERLTKYYQSRGFDFSNDTEIGSSNIFIGASLE